MSTRLIEQGRLSEATDAKNGIFPVTIISEGAGSSGVYSRELLESAAANGVFNKGTKSFIDHPKDASKPWERSLTTIAGTLVEDAQFVEEDGVGKLKSKLKVDSRWRDFVEEYRAVLGLSIYIGAFGEQDESGKTVVEEFDAEDPYKSVDLVVAAGRGGRFDLAMESYRQIESSLGNHPEETVPAIPPSRTTESKDISAMEIEELGKEVADLKAVVESFITTASPILESLKPGEPVEVDEAEVVESLIESGLTKRSRKAVLEAVRNGAAVKDAISDQKAVEDEFRSELRVQEGFVKGETIEGDALDLGKVFG